jgi:ataxia telangiectasia mutated family protein
VLTNTRQYRTSLNDKTYHHVFEVVIKAASLERASYLKTVPTSTRNASAARLASCATVLRQVVEISFRRLKYKTVKLIFSHIVQVLANEDGTFCEPLCIDYVKALRVLLSYTAHLDHLLADDWSSLWTFVITCIHDNSKPSADQIKNPFKFKPTEASDADSILVEDTSLKALARSARNAVEELSSCLALLARVKHVSMFDYAEQGLAAVFRILQFSTPVHFAYAAAISVFNSLLAKILVNDTALSTLAISSILPVICSSWNTKAQSIKEEMLISLIYGLPFIESLLLTGDQLAHGNVDNLLEILSAEHTKRPDRDQLALENLVYSTNSSAVFQTLPLRTPAFALRQDCIQEEPKWSILRAISALAVILDRAEEVSPGKDSVTETPSKRRRLANRSASVIRETRSPIASQKLFALQVCAFLISESELLFEDAQDFIDALLPCLGDEDLLISNWAALGLTALALSGHANVPELEDRWILAWQVSARLIIMPGTCRDACNLMYQLLRTEVIPFSATSASLNVLMASVELNGPVLMTDSSLGLLTTLLKLSNAEIKNATSSTRERSVQWFLSKWNPSRLIDRTSISHSAITPDPSRMMEFLCACFGDQSKLFEFRGSNVFGSLGNAAQDASGLRSLVNYLLFPDRVEQDLPSNSRDGASQKLFPKTSGHLQKTQTIVLDYISRETSNIRTLWRELMTQRSPSIILSALSNMVNFAVLTCLLSDSIGDIDSKRASQVFKCAEEIVQDVAKFASSEECDQSLFLSLMDIVHLYITENTAPETVSGHVIGNKFTLLSPIWTAAISQRQQSMEQLQETKDNDAMEVDDEFESQRSSSRFENSLLDNSKTETPIISSQRVSRGHNFALLQYSSILAQALGASQTNAETAGKVIDFLIALGPDELVACADSLADMEFLWHGLGRIDACRLLEQFGEGVLRSYSHERSEAAYVLCLNLLNYTCQLWTVEDDDLSEVAKQLYVWFVNVAIEKDLLSNRARLAFSSLSSTILRLGKNIDLEPGSPSPFASLLSVAESGDVVVKYQTSSIIASSFQYFFLEDHEARFENVLEILPKDADWKEGLALRLFTLGKLASKWPSLLRRSVYHIFESPAFIPLCSPFAKHTIQKTSHALHFDDVQSFFRVFAPQILYTWLSQESLDRIPYRIFGYSSLEALLKDIESEFISQVIMRGSDEELKAVSKALKTPLDQVAERSFTKAYSYSICRDLHNLKSNGNKKGSMSEQRLRRIVEKGRARDFWKNAIRYHFPHIVATIIRSLQDEHGFDSRILRDKRQFGDVLKSILEMRQDVATNRYIAPAQQPCFEANQLIDELLHACEPINITLKELWAADMYVFVIRNLLDSIEPSLGSIQTAQVIQKIRIVIALAQSTALQGYPLEMTLRALRPLLGDKYCVEDCVGIMKYLLTHGMEYLTQSTTFFVGEALLTLLHLQSLIGAPNDSMTQESQYLSIQDAAKSFHSWFRQYLKNYKAVERSKTRLRSIQAFIDSASRFAFPGTAVIEANEASLLNLLIKDEVSQLNVLDAPVRHQILAFLCVGLHGSLSLGDELLNLGDNADQISEALLRICQQAEVGDVFKQWASRVIGREFLSTGNELAHAAQETDLKLYKSFDLVDDALPLSKMHLIERVKQFLSSENRHEVSIAESTFRALIPGLQAVSLLTDYQQVLGDNLVSAFGKGVWEFPPATAKSSIEFSLTENISFEKDLSLLDWLRRLTILLVMSVPEDPVISTLVPILSSIDSFPAFIFPFVVHIALVRDLETNKGLRKKLSVAFDSWLRNCTPKSLAHVKTILNAALYLRTRPRPNEHTKADRDTWLELDFKVASEAAIECKMFKTSLLFLEVQATQKSSGPRRSSRAPVPKYGDLLLNIYCNIDDPDAYYGVDRDATLATITEQFDFEKSAIKSLSFRGAQIDSKIRLHEQPDAYDLKSLSQSLNILNLNGLSGSFVQSQSYDSLSISLSDNVYDGARKLEQWDTSVPDKDLSESATIFRALQCLNNISGIDQIKQSIDQCFKTVIDKMTGEAQHGASLRPNLRSLAILTEIDETLNIPDGDDLKSLWTKMQHRSTWMKSGNYEDVSSIISCRQSLISSLGRRQPVQPLVRANLPDLKKIEADAAVQACRMSRLHGVTQDSLWNATNLSQLVGPCQQLGVRITAISQYELALTIWEQGEHTTSVRMLQRLNTTLDSAPQTIDVGRSELLAGLGHRVAEARLEKPDEVISNYLVPAVKELRGRTTGDEAGQVFHEFASFCDQQLQNPDNLEDYRRIQRLRQRKEEEVVDLERMLRSSTGTQRDQLKRHRAFAKIWLDLDDREFRRLRESRLEFLKRSLENYLLSLAASEKYNSDSLRFCALWLEHSESHIAQKAVDSHLTPVPSRKFAPLMNQLSSRLLDTAEKFQTLLLALVRRIAQDHPYHGLYQIFSASKVKTGKDPNSDSRQRAAVKLVNQLKGNDSDERRWIAVHNSSVNYIRLAMEKFDAKYKPGSKVLLEMTEVGKALETQVPEYKVPPPTMTIPLREDCDYSNVPVITSFSPDMSIASGVSAPKIITCITSDGAKYKQLVKGGNDDLRQDAIMEQVFAQVNELLGSNRETRRRKLGIRTYKVLPLTTTTGVLEFVPNTIPLHDFLIPAHQRYHPRDWKSSMCRKTIQEVQGKSLEIRLKTYREACEHFSPVMRFFFTELFNSPDEWFEKRLAYTRSTAAISILGHVLGLGDRHGHNILLDQQTGEAVHIDLGVSFEQGRVLPVPEVVPFRLTRDIVDGMGITKTEGVFRKCCEFTLDALRRESYSILTILDVFRYDPLYSWSVSPLRIKRLQEAQTAGMLGTEPSTPSKRRDTEDVDDMDLLDPLNRTKRKDDDASEADRALTVVAKKLSKSLSVEATVNELIQQASDERNLAVLYCGMLYLSSVSRNKLTCTNYLSGWAAYA